MDILLGTDGSRYAVAAARFLSLHLRGRGHTVHLVAVVPTEAAGEDWPGVSGKDVERQARNWLDRTSVPLEAQGISVTREIRRGDPGEVLTRLASRGRYDLTVVGVKGRGDSPFFDIGSTALTVSEYVPTDVLLMRDPHRRGKPPPTHLDPYRVVIPADGSPKADGAVEDLFRLFTFAHLVVDLVSVVDLRDLRPLQRLPRSRREALVADLQAEADEALRRAREQIEPHQEADLILHRPTGDPAAAIVEVARDAAADLIALGTRAVGELGERHLGRVALEVTRTAPCSVLVVRERPATRALRPDRPSGADTPPPGP